MLLLAPVGSLLGHSTGHPFGPLWRELDPLELMNLFHVLFTIVSISAYVVGGGWQRVDLSSPQLRWSLSSWQANNLWWAEQLLDLWGLWDCLLSRARTRWTCCSSWAVVWGVSAVHVADPSPAVLSGDGVLMMGRLDRTLSRQGGINPVTSKPALILLFYRAVSLTPWYIYRKSSLST